jgi:hypothetical protein
MFYYAYSILQGMHKTELLMVLTTAQLQYEFGL